MPAGFHQATVLQDSHLIGGEHRIQSMRHDQDNSTA